MNIPIVLGVDTKKNKILLIEDDIDISEALSSLLCDEGYSVKTAMNGQEALIVLEDTESLPNLILLDLMMPIMDGSTFLQKKISRPNIKAIPTIVMSADATRTINDRALSSAVAFIKKPLDLNLLLETLKTEIASI